MDRCTYTHRENPSTSYHERDGPIWLIPTAPTPETVLRADEISGFGARFTASQTSQRSLEGQNGSTPPSLSVWLGWTSIYHHFTSIYQLFWDFDPSPKMISSKHDVGRCRTLCSAQVDPSAITWIEYDRFWKTSMQKIYISKECLYYIILSYSTSTQKPHDFLVLWISTLNSTEKPLTSAVAYITVHFSGLLTVPLRNERSSTALAVAWAALSSTFQSVRGLWGFYFESWIAPNTTPCWNELELWKKRCPNHLVLYIKNDGGNGQQKHCSLRK